MQVGLASHVVVNAVGETVIPVELAIAVQLTSTVPFAWTQSFVAGSGWQVEQASGAVALRLPAGRTWASCAPTPTVPALFPFVSTPVVVPTYPGAADGSVFAAAAPVGPASTPWQAVQPFAGAWTVPSRCVVFAAPERPAVAYPVPWHAAQFVFCGWSAVEAPLTGGGAPWHVPHACCDEPAVQSGDRIVPPGVASVVALAPYFRLVGAWQYVDEQFGYTQLGLWPFVVASVPQSTSFTPLCVAPLWHSEHGSGFARRVAWFTCATCAPTARVVVAVSPFRPSGGAACWFASAPPMLVRVELPWQAVQPRVAPHCGVPDPWQLTAEQVFVAGS